MLRPLLTTVLRVLFVAALALGLYIECQAGYSTTITMSSHAKLTAANGKKVLADVYTVAEAKAEYPDAFRAMGQLRGWSDGSVMQLALINAFTTDALWRGGLYQTVVGSPQGRLISRNRVVFDVQGAWWANDYVYYGFGSWVFPNAGPGNADYGGDLGGWELVHWKEKWVGPQANRTATNERILLSAFHGGSDQLVDYSEGTWFEGALRIDGRAGDYRSATGPLVVNVEWWDMGEASQVPGLFSHHGDIGQRYARGTPANAPYTQSTFSNTVCGTEFMGVANINVAMLSGDDNPELWRSVPGYGRPATLNANIQNEKAEWAVTPASLRLWKPQGRYLEGQFKVNVGLLTYAATLARTESMYRLKPTLSDSYLRVEVLDVFNKQGPDYFVHDLTNGKAWKFDPWVVGFEYSSLNGGTLKSWPVQAQEVALPAGPRKGYVTSGSAFPTWSDVTGNGGTVITPTPTPTPLPTPVPPATPYTLAWSTSFAGTNVRTLVAGTGFPSITVDLAWKGLATVTGGAGTTQVNTQFPLNMTGVRRVVLKGCTVASPVREWSVLNSQAKVKADGTVVAWDGNTVIGRCTPGTKGTVELVWPAPVDLTYVLGMLGQPCALLTAEDLEVYR